MALLPDLVGCLAFQARQEGILDPVVRLFPQLFRQLGLALLLSFAEGVFEELLGAALLHCLLLEDILQQVLVALNEPLRVDLPMLHLLLPVTLDTL